MTDARQDTEIIRTLVRLNSQAWGIALGLLFGAALLAATLVLVVRGGAVVGPHLSLLGVFLPGYRVTVGGAFLGFVYGFVIGYVIGRVIGGVYNRLARFER